MCYVHNVTGVQKPGNVRYTTCQLQTAKDITVKAICFSPQKVPPLKTAMENKSPVKIRKFEFNEKFQNVVIRNSTAVSEHQNSLPFGCADYLSNKVVPIKVVKSMVPGQLVTVKAKVMNLSGEKFVRTVQYGPLRKTIATLIDPTGSISVTFWEDFADSVENGKTYLFTNLKTKKDGCGELCVNNPKEGFKVEEVEDFSEDLPDALPSLLDVASKDITISIMGVKSVGSYDTCVSCGGKVEKCGALVKCLSNSCKLSQRVNPKNRKWYARLFVQDVATKEKLYLSAFHNELAHICEAKHKEISEITSEDELTSVLLTSEDLHISYGINDSKLLHINI